MNYNEGHLNKFSRSKRRSTSEIKPNAKAWVIKAINAENKKPEGEMWKNEPSQRKISKERKKRIRFLRTHGKADPELFLIADHLERCTNNNPCCSGACPKCGRLFQRFYVRRTKTTIRDIIAPKGSDLVALCIIPISSIVRPGHLHKFSIANFQRRFKTALDSAGIKFGLGGVDFSFNEDLDEEWQPFICPHIYFITATSDKDALHQVFKSIYKSSPEIPKPVKVTDFENTPWRRSYSLKMSFKRRISYRKKRKGSTTTTKNTSTDSLRIGERIELFKYLHQIGFASRMIFRGIKPEYANSKVRFRKA